MLEGLIVHDDAGVYLNDESESWNVNDNSDSWSSPIGVSHVSYIQWALRSIRQNFGWGLQERKHTKSISNFVVPKFTIVTVCNPFFKAAVWNNSVWKTSSVWFTSPFTGGYMWESMVTWYKPWSARSAPYSCTPVPEKVKETLALVICVTV